MAAEVEAAAMAAEEAGAMAAEVEAEAMAAEEAFGRIDAQTALLHHALAMSACARDIAQPAGVAAGALMNAAITLESRPVRASASGDAAP